MHLKKIYTRYLGVLCAPLAEQSQASAVEAVAVNPHPAACYHPGLLPLDSTAVARLEKRKHIKKKFKIIKSSILNIYYVTCMK